MFSAIITIYYNTRQTSENIRLHTLPIKRNYIMILVQIIQLNNLVIIVIVFAHQLITIIENKCVLFLYSRYSSNRSNTSQRYCNFLDLLFYQLH